MRAPSVANVSSAADCVRFGFPTVALCRLVSVTQKVRSAAVALVVDCGAGAVSDVEVVGVVVEEHAQSRTDSKTTHVRMPDMRRVYRTRTQAPPPDGDGHEPLTKVCLRICEPQASKPEAQEPRQSHEEIHKGQPPKIEGVKQV